MAFEAIVKKQIERLKSPMVKCVDMVVEELSKVVHACSERVCIYPSVRSARFPHLRGSVFLFMENFLSSGFC